MTFEAHERREMLDCAPLLYGAAFTNEATRSAFYSSALLQAAPIIALTDARSDETLASNDALALASYETDSTGLALAPAYGETVCLRVVVQNAGNDTLEVDSITLSEGSRVEIVGGYKSTLASNEEAILTLKWSAIEPEASTLTITTNDPEQPTFELDLSGSIRANTTILPSLGAVSLIACPDCRGYVGGLKGYPAKWSDFPGYDKSSAWSTFKAYFNKSFIPNYGIAEFIDRCNNENDHQAERFVNAFFANKQWNQCVAYALEKENISQAILWSYMIGEMIAFNWNDYSELDASLGPAQITDYLIDTYKLSDTILPDTNLVEKNIFMAARFVNIVMSGNKEGREILDLYRSNNFGYAIKKYDITNQVRFIIEFSGNIPKEHLDISISTKEYDTIISEYLDPSSAKGWRPQAMLMYNSLKNGWFKIISEDRLLFTK